MKQLQTLGLIFFSLLSSTSHAESTYEYKAEFEAFKNSPRYEAIFNENAPRAMSDLQAKIEMAKHLSYTQRFSPFFKDEAVTINAETMPKLYTYIDTMCKEHQIATPVIFITRDITWKHGIFNAAACKLLFFSGAIEIYQRVLTESTDAMIEAIIAHEIGHIKNNHVNKILATFILSYIAIYATMKATLGNNDFKDSAIITKIKNILHQSKLNDFFAIDDFFAIITSMSRSATSTLLGFYMSKFIIGKRFEKQADEFAYKTMGKAYGHIEASEYFKKIDKTSDEYYDKTYTLLQESKKDINFLDRISLLLHYYKASYQYKKAKIYMWFYYNTPLGAHPSDDARIKAAKDYLASLEQVQAQ